MMNDLQGISLFSNYHASSQKKIGIYTNDVETCFSFKQSQLSCMCIPIFSFIINSNYLGHAVPHLVHK